jgi:hypothetical protein
VLVLGLGSPHWFFTPYQQLLKAVQELVQIEELQGILMISWKGAKGNLRSACRLQASSMIYQRQSWENTDTSKRIIYERPVVARKSFIVRNRASIVGLCLLIAFIAGALFFRPTQHVYETPAGSRRLNANSAH